MFICLCALPIASTILTWICSLAVVFTCSLKLVVLGLGNTLASIDNTSNGLTAALLITGPTGQPAFARLEIFEALSLLTPQSDVNATLMVSPTPAAALLVYLIRITLPVTVPESSVPVDPTG